MRSLWVIFKSELYKRIILERRYFLEVLSDFIVYYILFMGIYGFIRINASSLPQEELNRLVSMQIVGYISWFFFSFTVNFIHNGISRELTEGTFEQLCINPSSILKIYVIKLVVGSIRNIILLLPLITMLTLSTGITVKLNLVAFGIFCIMLIGIFGFSLLLGGLGLYFKRIGQLPFIISILFLGTSIVDMSKSSPILQGMMNILPFTKGTEMIKQFIGYNQAILSSDLLLLSINSALYLTVGLFLFTYYLNKAKTNGSLARF